MAKYDYDLIILGGGIAGFSAAGMAAGLGKKVLLIEKDRLGGNCSLRTCVPVKALVRAGEACRALAAGKKFGLIYDIGKVDVSSVNTYVRQVIEEVATIDSAESFTKMGIAIDFGSPSFIDNHRIRLGEATISANKFIIATGNSPARLDVEGAADTPYYTSESIFQAEKLPSSLIILGGGPAGIEYATAYNLMGIDVSVVELADNVLSREDRELADMLLHRLQLEGVKFFTGCRTTKLARTGESVSVDFNTKTGEVQTITAGAVLMTIGRVPNTAGLSLENAGVKYTAKGITVNPGMRTTAPNIYAAGDVVGPYTMGSLAEAQALIAANNALIPVVKKRISYDNMVWITYSSPPLAHIGLTEEEARKLYGDEIKVYHADYNRMRRAKIDQQHFGVAKFVTNKSGKAIGIHILGHNAEELAHEAQLLRALNKPLHALHSISHAYPTYSEAMFKRMGDISYLDKMSNNPIIRFGLNNTPGYVNNLDAVKEKL